MKHLFQSGVDHSALRVLNRLKTAGHVFRSKTPKRTWLEDEYRTVEALQCMKGAEIFLGGVGIKQDRMYKKVERH